MYFGACSLIFWSRPNSYAVPLQSCQDVTAHGQHRTLRNLGSKIAVVECTFLFRDTLPKLWIHHVSTARVSRLSLGVQSSSLSLMCHDLPCGAGAFQILSCDQPCNVTQDAKLSTCPEARNEPLCRSRKLPGWWKC